MFKKEGNLLADAPTSTGIKQLTGEPVGLLGGEEENHIGHVFRLADTAQWGMGGDIINALGREIAGLDGTGCDNIDGNAVPAQF